MATLQEMLGGRGVTMVDVTKKRARGGQQAPPAARFNLLGKVKVPTVTAIVVSKEEREAQLAEFSATRDSIAATMQDAVRNIRYIDTEATEPEAAILASARAEAEEAIMTMLRYDEPYKAVAVLAYASALVRTCPEHKLWVEDTVKQLVGIGFMKLGDSRVATQVYGQGYILAGDFGKSIEATEVMKTLVDLIGRERIAAKQRFEAKKAELDAAVGGTPISIEDLKSGKEGRLVMQIPDQTTQKGSEKRVYKGGFVLVDSAAGKIRILDGAGGVQRISAQLHEAGVFLYVPQLTADKIDTGGARIPEESFRNMVILQKMLQRGFAEADKKSAANERRGKFHEQVDSEREAYKAKATLTLPQFFMLDRIGTCFVDPLGHKAFIANRGKKNEARTSEVFCLVERNEKGYIRIADSPARLADFFAPDDKEFKPAGEKFAGLSWKLCALLKMGFAAALAEASPEEKSAHQTMRSERVQNQSAAIQTEADNLAAELAAGSGEDISGVKAAPIPEDK